MNGPRSKLTASSGSNFVCFEDGGKPSISSRSKRLLPVQKTPASHLGANPIPTLRRAFILVVSHTIQIVWFKRDLRTLDHTALSNACKRGPVLPLFLVERQMLRAPDCSSLHWNFVSEALNELRDSLRKMGLPLLVLDEDVVSAFTHLLSVYGKIVIHCHEETGNAISFERDRHVRNWTREQGVELNEYPQNGVIRGMRNRDGWSRKWNERMNAR